jgi:hypothetical protein
MEADEERFAAFELDTKDVGGREPFPWVKVVDAAFEFVEAAELRGEWFVFLWRSGHRKI